MDKKTIILFFILGFLIFILGGGMGVFYQSQKCLPENCPSATKETSALEKTIKDLSSRTIYFIVAYGTVEDINGRKLTISNNGENLTVEIKENAEITSFIRPVAGGNSSTPEAIAKFEDIKKGDNLRISLKVLPDGKITGESVIIIY